jgi:hypothetical protein
MKYGAADGVRTHDNRNHNPVVSMQDLNNHTAVRRFTNNSIANVNMKKFIQQVVENCRECEYSHRTFVGSMYCRHNAVENWKIITVPITKFPDWCSIPDADEVTK